MPHRVAAALPLLEEQLTPERLQYFRTIANDPLMFTVEVVSAHIEGEIDMPDGLLRRLVSTMNLPLDDE